MRSESEKAESGRLVHNFNEDTTRSKKVLYVELPSDLVVEIRELARVEGRYLNWLVENFLRKGLNQYGNTAEQSQYLIEERVGMQDENFVYEIAKIEEWDRSGEEADSFYSGQNRAS